MPWQSQAAAAAKSLQSRPTLCDPIDSSPPGSPVPRPTTKKWVMAPNRKIPTPSPKSLKYPSYSLAYEITHPYKNWQPHTLVPLSASEMAHTLFVECVSPLLTCHFLTEFFLPRGIKNLSFTKSWDQVWSQLKGWSPSVGFGWLQVPVLEFTSQSELYGFS